MKDIKCVGFETITEMDVVAAPILWRWHQTVAARMREGKKYLGISRAKIISYEEEDFSIDFHVHETKTQIVLRKQ